MLSTLRTTLIGATLVAALGVGVAVAQTPPPGHDAMAAHHMGGDPATHIARHAQHLRDALQLTPAQEPALQALVSSMTPPAGAHERMERAHGEMANLTTPERLDRMRKMMSEHMAMFDQHAKAVETFYAQLTPTQKKAFDAMPMGHHGMGHHGMGGEHGHGF
jgi:hypothetical protein